MNQLPPRFGRHRGPQSSMPSQDDDVAVTGLPFNPVNQPDMRRPYPTKLQPDFIQGQDGATVPIDMADVRSVFDSRPVNAYDFYYAELFEDGARALAAYVVPDGYTFVLRAIGVEMYARTISGSPVQMNEFGDMSLVGVGVTTPKLQLQVNGAATPLWTPYGSTGLNGVPLFNVWLGEFVIPTFAIIGEGSSFSIHIPNFIDAAGGTNANTYAHYYGNMMLASGRQLADEIANAEPLPVTQR